MLSTIGLTPLAIKASIEVLQQNLDSDEPIDDYERCNLAKLNASLMTPFQRPRKAIFREDVIEKTALTFFLLIENHTLPTNGNKRMATMALLVMLAMNGFMLRVSDNELYQIAISVTSKTKDREGSDEILMYICKFLDENIEQIMLNEYDGHELFELEFEKHIQR